MKKEEPIMSDGRVLEEMTWDEVRQSIAAGNRTVVVPTGSIEQHGPHLPVATDTCLAVALADRVVAQVAGTLRGPVVSLGISAHHLAFPGTISVRQETFLEVLGDYVASLERHGFRTAYVFSAHGGNFAALAELERWANGRAGGIRVLCYADLERFFQGFFAVSRAEGIPDAVCGVHAGEGETSEMLAVSPAAVRLRAAATGFVGSYDDAAQRKLWSEGIQALTENGVMGDPRAATAERGERYLDSLAVLLAEDLRRRAVAS
jgi:creatinine amidohydrolase